MRKHLVSISVAVLLLIGALCGCTTQNKQNNSTTLEDTVVPTTPSNVRCTSPITDTTPTFSWNASTDASGVAGYYVKIDTSGDIWVGNIITWNSTSELADGTHIFYVKVKDASTNGNNGTYGACSFIINTTTGEKPPVAVTNGPYVWFVNQSITFDGSKSYDSDGSIVNYTWSLGDGTILYGEWVAHSYSKTGEYNISLTVVDNESLANTNTTIAKIQSYSGGDGNQNNGSGESSTEQERFLGSWHNEANDNEHWIFYSNWTQKYTNLQTDNLSGEQYTSELWFNYTVNASMLCQIPLIDYNGIPWCYGYEFSNNDQVLTLFNYGAMMVVLIKD